MLPSGVLGIVGRVGIGGIGESGSGRVASDMFERGDKGEVCWIEEEAEADDVVEDEDRVNDSIFLSPSLNRLGWRFGLVDTSSVDVFSATVVVVSVWLLAESAAGPVAEQAAWIPF